MARVVRQAITVHPADTPPKVASTMISVDDWLGSPSEKIPTAASQAKNAIIIQVEKLSFRSAKR
jgi:hypothetical protein